MSGGPCSTEDCTVHNQWTTLVVYKTEGTTHMLPPWKSSMHRTNNCLHPGTQCTGILFLKI